jgi:hypothetical protein
VYLNPDLCARAFHAGQRGRCTGDSGAGQEFAPVHFGFAWFTCHDFLPEEQIYAFRRVWLSAAFR